MQSIGKAFKVSRDNEYLFWITAANCPGFATHYNPCDEDPIEFWE